MEINNDYEEYLETRKGERGLLWRMLGISIAVILGLLVVAGLVYYYATRERVPEQMSFAANEDHEMSVKYKYPENWECLGFEDPGNYCKWVYSRTGNLYSETSMGVEFEKMTAPTLEEHILSVAREADIDIQGMTHCDLDVQAALRVEGTDGWGNHQVAIYCLRYDRVYSIWCKAPQRLFSGYERFFQEIFDSFEFLKVVPTELSLTTRNLIIEMDPYTITTSDASHVWVGGLRNIYFFNGSSWSFQFEADDMIKKLTAYDGQNIWAVDIAGGIYSSDGESWLKRYDSNANLFDVVGLPSGQAWASGLSGFGFNEGDEGIILYCDGLNWHKQLEAEGTIFSLCALDENHIWAAGLDGVWFYNGDVWIKQFNEPCSDISASDAHNIWAVSGDLVYYSDGNKWSTQFQARFGMRDIAVADSGNIWAIGSYESGIDQICMFYDGSSWSEQDWIFIERVCWLLDISASSGDNVWLVGLDSGEANVIYRYDGSKWIGQQ